MRRGVLAQLLALVLVALGYALAPQPFRLAGAAIGLGISAFGIAYGVTAPRVQWFVPTRFRGRSETPSFALTFDDGPDPIVTPKVLALLAAHEVKATFFLVGQAAEQHPEIVRQLTSAGHALGSHTYSHSNGFHFLRSRAMAEEIARGERAIAAVVGHAPRYFRPPQGLRVPTLRDALTHLDAAPLCVTWSGRALDTTLRSSTRIEQRLRKALRPGAILTLHDGTAYGGHNDRAGMLRALDALLIESKRRGLRAVTLDDLLT
jgi:peptidoglycan-N-acetylglucosamine deacetylase